MHCPVVSRIPIIGLLYETTAKVVGVICQWASRTHDTVEGCVLH